MGSAPVDGFRHRAGLSPGTAVLTPPANDAPRDVSQLSCVQQRLWLAGQAAGDGLGYHLGWAVYLHGDLDIAALRAALGEIVRRHEVLRSRLLDTGGQLLSVSEPGAAVLPVIETTAAAADELARELVRRPFLAGAGPLWRCELYREGPASHRLVIAIHHAIADASTATLLFRELSSAYRAWHDGCAPSLPRAIPYSVYCAWERDFLSSPECGALVAYWSGQVAGLPPLDLPSDRPRQPGAPRWGAVASRVIPAGTAAALRQLAKTQGGSLTHVLLAGYATVLHRYTGTDEFAIGLPVSTRHGQRWATSAGPYINTVPIRVRLAGNPPFWQLVRQIRDTVLTALGAADVPLDQVVAAVRADRQPGELALFNVVFGMTPGGPPQLDLPGLTTRVTPLHPGQAKSDLHLEVSDRGPGGSLRVLLEYDAGLFGRQTARRILRSLCAVLAGAAAAPGRRIGALPLADAGAGDPIGPEHDPGALPGGGRVDVLLAETAAARAGQVALIDAASGAQLRYAELVGLIRSIAAKLAEHGIGRGHFVGITLARSVDLVVAICGVLTAGAAYVPLDVSYPVARLAEMVKVAGVRLVIGPAPSDLGVPALDLNVMDLSGTDPSEASLPGGHPVGTGGSAQDPAYIMFTSGSTGKPKAVVVPHQGIVRLVRDSGFAEMTADDRWLHASPPSFDGSTMELWPPLLNGGSLVVLAGPPTVEALGDAIGRHKVTATFMTTGLFHLVVDTDVNALRPLRQVVVCGEVASATHMRQAVRVVPTVINAYGPTENTCLTTCHIMRSARAVTSPVPIGVPIRGTVVQVVDAYLNPMPPGAVGEILTGGEGLATGYAGAPGLTAERFVPSQSGPAGARMYRTGDYGWLDPGGVLHFVGRKDDQVKVRGFRVEFGEVEHALRRVPGVTQAAVTVRADPTGARRLIGYTVGTASDIQIADYLRERLPGYMIPTQWVRLDALPLGPTGKVDRHALPGPSPQPATDPGRPVTAVEEALIGWYSELLGIDSPGLDTDFIAAGGHSLLGLRLVNRIRAAFDVEVSLATILSSPCLADLAAILSADQQARERLDPVVRMGRLQTNAETRAGQS